jgi:uncharacterized metal-binding protein
MAPKETPRCATCDAKACAQGHDCFQAGQADMRVYDAPRLAELHRTASTIEAAYYGRETRLGEIVRFARELGCRKLGLAFCIGLSDEARVIERILAEEFDVVSVCCKVSGLDKQAFGLDRIRPDTREVMCNPAGQAALMNRAETDLNVVCGLCVGHDAIFGMLSEAPVTTLIAKDRVLAHNPVGAVYCPYVRRNVVTGGSRSSRDP